MRRPHCASGDFGASLAVGDLDDDGTDELLVGAPEMALASTERAGKVWVYSLDKAEIKLRSILHLAIPHTGAQLGRSLALPLVAGRRIIAAGAPGANQVALFF